VVCGVGARRGFAWCVRSQVVGMTASGARASGAGDAVNGKYEKKIVLVVSILDQNVDIYTER